MFPLAGLVRPPGVPGFVAGPPSPSQILRPAIRTLPYGVERYVVPAGGSVSMPVYTGDKIRIVNTEGGQRAELMTADDDGKIDIGMLGQKPNSSGDGIRGTLGRDDETARNVRAKLERRGLDLAKAQALTLFGFDTPARTSEEFTVNRRGIIVVAAPGGTMAPDAHDTTTNLELFITRASPQEVETPDLPEPLADPQQDIRIAAATAQAFTVKAGEYFQVIDVEGRECSDLQCFSLRKLDKGIVHPLDPTTTRTLVGVGYPTPGLPSKAFDTGFEPLVELVRDTCGRHDAFGLACTNRYYEDMGYFGHINCTDNFNRAITPYGVPERPGWMALNLFFNTGIDDTNAMFFDEPWSRPGDYVLFKALTDLVCLSSACPCDIDAANGWNPTDIHVRTYAAKEFFSKAVAFRMTPEADPQLTRETGFHSSFAKHTRDFVEYKGFWLPNSFHGDGPIAEYWACREKAAIIDLSPLRKFEVTGPDAERLMQYTMTRNIRKLSAGQVVYTAMCYEHGGMVDDGTVFRLAQDNFRWIGGDEYGGEWLREQAEKLGLKVWIRSSTDQQHNVAVQGPLSRDILKEVIWTRPDQPTIEELGWFRFTVGRLHGFEGPPVLVSRTGYSGELGYEVFCHPSNAEEIFDAIWAVGEPLGMRPAGVAALDMLRIEAGLIFAGYEFDDQTDPFEAGIGFTVPLKSKEDDFIGREALIRRKEHPMKKLVGLDMHGDDVISAGDCIHIGRAQIGEVTSPVKSPILRKTIALARVDVTHAEPGTVVEVGKLDGHQKRLPATIVTFPHYDPQKTRVRS
jgi:aminomethyltransferase